MILSPHFDDAAISLGGLLAKEGAESVVATFFTGTPKPSLSRPWDLASGFADSSAAMQERVRENTLSLGSLRVPDAAIINYAYLDNQYREIPTYTGPGEAEIVSAIAKDIKKLLARFGGAQLSATFFPPCPISGGREKLAFISAQILADC